MLGQTEGDALGAAFVTIAAAIEKFKVEATSHANCELISVVEPLEEYVRYIEAIKRTIARRIFKLKEYSSAVLDFNLKEKVLS